MEPRRSKRKTGSLQLLLVLLSCGQVLLSIDLHASQDTLYMEVASDTVELGDVLEIRITLENTQGHIQAPQFEGLYPMGGPSTSTSMQIINGVTQSRHSVAYLTKVIEVGKIVIPPAIADLDDGGRRQTGSLEIISLASSTTEIEEHRLGEGHQILVQPRPKKKLKTRRI